MIRKTTHRILLVDDDPNCLDAIDQILRREGYETLPIRESLSVVKAITENNIDLAVLDFNMPDMNGLQVFYEIRKRYRNLPVILVTAEPSSKLRLESLKAGVHSLLSKPINIPNFKQVVAKALQSPRMETVKVRRQLVFTRWIGWIKHK